MNIPVGTRLVFVVVAVVFLVLSFLSVGDPLLLVKLAVGSICAALLFP